jgi:hypothetical protein
MDKNAAIDIVRRFRKAIESRSVIKAKRRFALHVHIYLPYLK